MSEDKIRISWDEVNSAATDQKLQQQGALTRAADHYQQQMTPSGTSTNDRPQALRLLYNSLVYTALFGLISGLSAWFVGEFVFLALRTDLERFADLAEQESAITNAVNQGEISEQEGRILLGELYSDHAGSPYVEILADDSLSDAEKEERIEQLAGRDSIRSFIQQLIWFSCLGIFISFGLSISDHVVGRNWRAAIINGSVGILLGLMGGILVGLFINHLYLALGGGGDEGEGSLVRQIFARSVGWAVLGLFIAIAPGIVLRNMKRCVIGLVGGFVGGLLGGLLFDPVGMVVGNAVISRMVAVTGIGFVAGLGTGLIENVAKTGWLKVVRGLIAGKQFILYKNPTIVGSSPQCEIYLFKDMAVASRHAAIHKRPFGYELEDLDAGSGTFVNGARVRRTRLRDRDEVQVGSTVFMFQEKDKS